MNRRNFIKTAALAVGATALSLRMLSKPGPIHEVIGPKFDPVAMSGDLKWIQFNHGDGTIRVEKL